MDCAFAISGYCFACFEFRAEGALKPVWFRLVRVMYASFILHERKPGRATELHLDRNPAIRSSFRLEFQSLHRSARYEHVCLNMHPDRYKIFLTSIRSTPFRSTPQFRLRKQN